MAREMGIEESVMHNTVRPHAPPPPASLLGLSSDLH